jgi:hypothetical protein
MENTVNIYCLKHPSTSEVMYVGKTIRPLEVRLHDHLNDKINKQKGDWIDKLINNGKKPVIELIETTDFENSHEVEKRWIRHYSLINPNLLNISNKLLNPVLKENEILEQVGNRIRKLRQEAGYKSHENFAFEHGIDRTQWSKMERGVDMKISTLHKALAALDISPAEFFRDFK